MEQKDPPYIIRVEKDRAFKLFGIEMTGNRLRNKIFTRVVLVSAIPMVMAAAVSLYIMDLSHKYDVAAIEDGNVQKAARDVKEVVEAVAEISDLQLTFSGDNAAIQRIFWFPDKPNEPKWTISSSTIEFLLSGIMQRRPDIEMIAIADVSSRKEAMRMMRNAAPGMEHIDVSNLEYFKKAAKGEIYTGPVYFTLNGPMITVSAPTVNSEDQVIGVITAEFKLDGVQEIVRAKTIGKRGYIYVVDPAGNLIAHSNGISPEISNAKHNELVADILKGKEYAGLEGQRRYISMWGEEVVAAGQPIPSLGWGVVAEWPVSDANSFLMLMRNQLMMFILLVIIATLLVSVFLSERIVNPIKRLERGTQLVSTGKFDSPVEIKTADEIEDLGKAFNEMTKGLKRLKELQEEFVFISAHELRTPVTAIKGYLQMVLEGTAGPITDKTREFLGQVVTANARLIQLVEDLLQVARSEAGRLTIKVASLQIKESVSEVISELKPLAEQKSISVIYEPGELPAALADGGRLKEVLVNLIGNAIKYTIGSGTVTITHEVKDNMIVTHIKDTGIGISQEAQKKLFEKFYRVQTEKTASITGTGLGLFIVKEIIEKMNGKIWVESEENVGSTFSFSLPVA